MSFINKLLNIIILLCVYLSRDFIVGAQERESGKVDYHTIQLSSLSPSSSCVHSSKEYVTKSSLRVVHKHGACSPFGSGKAVKLDHADILRRDQARVNSIHSKQSNNLGDRLTQTGSKDLPVKDEIKSKEDLGSGSYIVTIGIGTPEHSQPLIVDTGSDLTWTKCRQCGRYTSIKCHSKDKLIFNPSFSTSFDTVSSTSPVCSDLRSADIHRDCRAPRCCYGIKYTDTSSSYGFLAKEKFTVTSADVFDGIHFGCSENEAKINGKTAGVLGLSRHVLSFPSQTAKTYNNIFSYCLPSSGRTGLLTFGSTGISKSVRFTPMITLPDTPYLYGLDIVGITVGGKKLEIPSTVLSKPRAIIDSGTVITRLPPKAYAALRSAFKENMRNYTTTSGVELLDTCYDPKGFDTMAVPKVSFSFRGGTTVELGLNGILYPYDASHVCLAFAGNDNDGVFAIFGSVQQMTLQVVYDKAGGRIGFAQNGCS
ncbi:Eukaryotic aspartyl protease family protein [Raphanus sativus]|uniref:Aspartyl protease family protein At5g10770 n=1 Tax=Raphanus sativus TaxID=3726 RepID=A0A6J0L1T9_RAPSA|nr:aspartyl protease family protein At5g10770 [Raphanus sativus]KAJ4911868.1 Eukaryotic aspartyl protease family protein [Raphanus sativus]